MRIGKPKKLIHENIFNIYYVLDYKILHIVNFDNVEFNTLRLEMVINNRSRLSKPTYMNLFN